MHLLFIPYSTDHVNIYWDPCNKNGKISSKDDLSVGQGLL